MSPAAANGATGPVIDTTDARTEADAEAPEREALGVRGSALKSRIVALVRDEGPLVGGVNAVRKRLGVRSTDVSAALTEPCHAGTLVKGGSYHEPTFALAGTDGDV